MLGIEDPWIWGVYILCILSALLCVIYGGRGDLRGSRLGIGGGRDARERAGAVIG